jgi:hypothetical protein
MKKLILLLTLLLATSCATANNTPKEDPYATLTIEKVGKFCKPANLWNVSVLGKPAMIVVFEHCLEIDKLLLVSAPVLETNEELSTKIVDIVHLCYIDYLNETSDNKHYKTLVLKETYRVSKDEEKARSHITFYSIESTKKTK